ncbi:hypothetical protein, partial [Corynebacterium falsenii]|uniref:hypothetical protein n=1 Tax=Corynebacterium falsenii TaxID=108486 RepID=UPI001C725DD7
HSRVASKDTRVHYTVLKQHEPHTHTQPTSHVQTMGIPLQGTTQAVPDTQQYDKPRTNNNSHQPLVLTIHHTNPTPIVGHGP